MIDESREAELVRENREKDRLIAAQRVQIETLQSWVKIIESAIHNCMALETGHIDEIESLKNQVYNLTLYLKNAVDDLNVLGINYNFCFEAMSSWDRFGDSSDAYGEFFDGLPGYNPEILEARNEID